MDFWEISEQRFEPISHLSQKPAKTASTLPPSIHLHTFVPSQVSGPSLDSPFTSTWSKPVFWLSKPRENMMTPHRSDWNQDWASGLFFTNFSVVCFSSHLLSCLFFISSIYVHIYPYFHFVRTISAWLTHLPLTDVYSTSVNFGCFLSAKNKAMGFFESFFPVWVPILKEISHF